LPWVERVLLGPFFVKFGQLRVTRLPDYDLESNDLVAGIPASLDPLSA
jgi:hypothetical protein